MFSTDGRRAARPLVILLAAAHLLFAPGAARAQGTCVTQLPDVVAWYPGDGNAKDFASATPGSLQGNTTYTGGRSGQAFLFDGATDAVGLGSPAALQRQGFTIEAWIKRSSATQATLDSVDAGLILSYGQNGYGLYVDNAGRLGISKIGVSFVQTSTPVVTDVGWHHVAVTKSGTVVYFYVDGVTHAVSPYSATFEFTTNAAVGARGDTFFNSFHGAIDELTVYSRALTPLELHAVYAAGTAGKCKETRLTFGAPSLSNGEASGPYSLVLRRTGDLSDASSASYATVDGTAVAGQDYTPASGAFTFAPGEVVKPAISIPVANDGVAEGDESFLIRLSGISGAVGSPADTTLKIHDTPAGPGRILYNIANLWTYALIAVNVDGSHPFQLSSAKFGSYMLEPSVARLTGQIAFAGCGDFDGVDCGTSGYRIFVMNGDGTGRRAVTTSAGLGNPQYQNDRMPVISPDGTKVAFLSERPADAYLQPEVFVVDVATGALTQITSKQRPGDSRESYAMSVAWSPDSRQLLVHAFRELPYTTEHVGSLFRYNADGTGETVLVPQISNGLQGSLAIDWSPDGRNILYTFKAGTGHAVGGVVIANALTPTLDYRVLDLATLVSSTGSMRGDKGHVHFSPDGQRIVYPAAGPGSGSTTNGSIRTIRIDGTDARNVTVNDPHYTVINWWWPGPAHAAPARLAITPAAVSVWPGVGIPLLPTLYDAQDNVIFHAAQWEPFFSSWPETGYKCDSSLPACTGNGQARVDAGGTAVASTNGGTGERNWCASNAGQLACIRLGEYGAPPLSVTAATATASRAGTAGRFVIAPPVAAGEALVINFTLGGTAVRDVDYTIDVTGGTVIGNTITTLASAASYTVNVRGLATGGGSGPESIVFTLQSSPTNAYAVIAGANAASMTLADDAPGPGTVRLTGVSPGTGPSTGAVSVSVTGANIAAGAVLMLTRAGEVDLVGSTTQVATNGQSMTALVDLRDARHGAWSVVVTNPGGSSATLASAFTIGAASWNVWVDVVGRFTLRSGRDQDFYIVYGNTGTIDAPGTKFVLTLPTSLFNVTRVPQVPAGSPAFVTNHGEKTTYEMYVPSVPAGAIVTAPFRLRPTAFHQEFEFDIAALTSPSLGALVRTLDPSATLSVSVASQNAQGGSVTTTASSGGETVTVPITWTSTPTTLAEDVVVTWTQMNGYVDVRMRGTVGRNLAVLSAPGRVVEADLPPEVGDTITMTGQLPGTIGADGSVGTNYVNVAGGVIGTANAAAAVEDRQLINDYLLTHKVPGMAGGNIPMVDASELESLNGLATAPVTLNALNTVAGLPGSPVNAVAGSQFGAFTSVVDGAWAKRIYSLYTQNNDWMTNPNWRDARDFPLTQEELIIRLTLEAQKAREDRRRKRGTTLASDDPNDKVGPLGAGTAHHVRGVEPITYIVNFENLATATAAAQDVVITDQLDVTKFEIGTFTLGPITVAQRVITPPPGLSQWTTTVDLRPGTDLLLKIVAGLDVNTGVATWTFSSLDPVTGQPTTDPVAGFLPPNVTSPRGEGSVLFSILPKGALTTGTEIRNHARIVFDANAPIDTPVWLNAVDKSVPTSSVTALPGTVTTTAFPVAWSGSDTGSGIETYDVWVSENGGPFARWLVDTDLTTATYAGNVGRTYGFYSVARDGAGNEQPRPTVAQAATTVGVAVTADDQDGDGLPDAWETQFGLNPASAAGRQGAAGDADGDGRTNAEELAAGTHPAGAFVRYFAEGATSAFFATQIALANPSATTAATALLRFLKADGGVVTHSVEVPAGARRTVDVAGVPGMSAAEFATVIESNTLLVADRTLEWGGGYGGHAEASISGARTTWFLAEGATHSGFDLFYLVQNPNASAVDVQVTYLLPAPTAPIVKNYTVPANSRFNIWVDTDDPRLASTDVSAVISSSAPVIVERAMYLNSGGVLFAAGHDSAGVAAPGTSWFLAEGATGQYFDLFVLIANPSFTDAIVEARFLLPSGATVTKTYTVAAQSRFNIWVDLEDDALADTAVSTTLTSTNGVPIIVERTMWWPGDTGWQEAHNSPGARETGTKWGLAEGEQGGVSGRETYVLIANASAAAGSARVTLLFEDGTSVARTFPLNPNSRFNVAIGAEFPEAAGRRFGVTVESLGAAPAQVVVERAVYWNANGVAWAAGTNALATRLR